MEKDERSQTARRRKIIGGVATGSDFNETRLRVAFSNRECVFTSGKRLDKRRRMAVREDDRRRDATRQRAWENIRSGWHVSRDDGKRNETPSSREKRRGDKRDGGRSGGGRNQKRKKSKKEVKGERKRDAVYKERVQTRQLRSRPRTAIKSRNKQTTSSPLLLLFVVFPKNPPRSPLSDRPNDRRYILVWFLSGTETRRNRRHPFSPIVTPPPSSLSLALSSASFRSRVVSLSRFASPLISAGESDASTRRGVPVRFDRIFQGSHGARARESNAPWPDALSSFHRAPYRVSPQCYRRRSAATFVCPHTQRGKSPINERCTRSGIALPLSRYELFYIKIKKYFF